MKASLAVCFLFLSAPSTHANGNPRQQDSIRQQGAPAQAPQAKGWKVTPAQAAIDPVKAADIQRLLDVAGMKQIMSETLDAMEANVRPSLIKSLPPGDYRERLADLFFEKFRAKLSMQKMLDMAAAGYDKYLSDDDIKGLIQFYQTPLGQKTLTVLPQLTAELQTEGMQMGQQAGRESMNEVLTEHPELAKALQDASHQ